MLFILNRPLIFAFQVILLLLSIPCLLSAQQADVKADSITYSIFLVGDAGKITDGQAEIFKILKPQLDSAAERSTLIFLGDNLYPQGMPAEHSLDRKYAEAAIDKQLSLTKGYKGKYFFIPGNHDWAQGRSYGWAHLRNQERYIESKATGDNVFLPDGGCPGPVAVSLNEEVELIIVDSQWFLYRWDKPNQENSECAAANAIEVLQMMEDIIVKHPEKKIVVAMHHPMYTYGNHGGFNTVKDHFFPLTELFPKLYIPLPVIGSIYPMFRKVFGNIQDVSHPQYRAMRNSMVRIFEKYPNLIHVSGHEHAMEYAYKDSIHYVVSGSGCKTAYVRTKGFAEYTESVNGYARLDFYSNGKVKVEFWKSVNSKAEVAFEKELMELPFRPRLSIAQFEKSVDLSDSTVVVNASDQYNAKGRFGQWLMGENYRKEWRQPIRVPVFDIGKEHGGLKIVQRGGGMQTKSLRLEAKDGRQYVLRSVEKYPENAVPAFLRQTFAVDLVQDQISAAHPYGALVVPGLAQAAGVYHTNPKLVYLPDDPRFGDYQKTFANTLMLYEERPADDWSEADFFGNSKKIVSTTKVIQKLWDDNDNRVDEVFTLRSRLFDLVIGDWDRHDDQWRWATMKSKNGKGKVYRPIPRDRDQAFFINEGFLPRLASRKWALPKLEGFDHTVRWPSGFMFNARYFDRSFLTGLSEEQWLVTANELKNSLDDQSIEEAVRQWPDSIYLLHGPEVVEKIKARRDKLDEYAVKHYKFLARTVDVVGSDKQEYFSAIRQPNGDLLVTMDKINKQGERKRRIYERLFKQDETREVRLYGLGGEDVCVIKGNGRNKIKLRVVGGDGHDRIIDSSRVSGFRRMNIIYDDVTDNEIVPGSETRVHLSDDPAINRYDRKSFQYNVMMPVITANFNPDDGIFVGGGFTYTAHGFRKVPYRSRHALLLSYALNTSSYEIRYKGDFTDVIGSWSLGVALNVRHPNFVNNFFGMGNESIFDQRIDERTDFNNAINYYRLRFQEVSSSVGFSKRVGDYAKLSLSHIFQSIEIEDSNGQERFIDLYAVESGERIETYKTYTGAAAALNFDKRDSEKLTTSGVVWDNRLSVLRGISKSDKLFGALNSELSFYYSFRTPTSLTMAMRFGYGINKGEYEFYQSQILDGKTELRGYRKTRFYGDQKFYNNIELRWHLFSFRTYIFPASLGILAFNDIGRVWLDGEDSNTWHQGFGGGVWVSPFNTTVVSAEVGHSREETLFYIRLGFMF